MYYDKYNTGLSMKLSFYYWKCNFPKNLNVRLIFSWLVRQLVSWLVGGSVWHNILK